MFERRHTSIVASYRDINYFCLSNTCYCWLCQSCCRCTLKSFGSESYCIVINASRHISHILLLERPNQQLQRKCCKHPTQWTELVDVDCGYIYIHIYAYIHIFNYHIYFIVLYLLYHISYIYTICYISTTYYGYHINVYSNMYSKKYEWLRPLQQNSQVGISMPCFSPRRGGWSNCLANQQLQLLGRYRLNGHPPNKCQWWPTTTCHWSWSGSYEKKKLSLMLPMLVNTQSLPYLRWI